VGRTPPEGAAFLSAGNGETGSGSGVALHAPLPDAQEGGPRRGEPKRTFADAVREEGRTVAAPARYRGGWLRVELGRGRASIRFARSKSALVRPPASWVERVSVTSR